jgi:hypothetical protein
MSGTLRTGPLTFVSHFLRIQSVSIDGVMDFRLQYVRQILFRLTFHLQFSIPFEDLSSNVANSVQDFSAGRKIRRGRKTLKMLN